MVFSVQSMAFERGQGFEGASARALGPFKKHGETSRMAARNNISVFVLYIGVWLSIDLIDITLFKISGHEYEFLIILGMVLLSFVWVNKQLFKKRVPFFRWLSIFLLSAGLTVIWFFITMKMLVEIHLSIYGMI